MSLWYVSEQYAGRYEHHTGKSRIPKLFHNCRSSWVTDLVKVFGLNKHDCAKWIGHTEAIQDSNYLQMISEDIYLAMANAIGNADDSKNHPKNHPSYIGSFWFNQLYIALQTNHPELVEAALEHAQNITKIGMRGLFRIPSVDIASHSTTSLAEVLSSEGGTREIALKHLELQSRQGACGKYRGQYRVHFAYQPARTRHAIGHRCTRMHGTGMASG